MVYFDGVVDGKKKLSRRNETCLGMATGFLVRVVIVCLALRFLSALCIWQSFYSYWKYATIWNDFYSINLSLRLECRFAAFTARINA